MASKMHVMPSPVISFEERFRTTRDLLLLMTLIKLETPSSPILFFSKLILAILSVGMKLPMDPARSGPSYCSPRLILRLAHKSLQSSWNLEYYSGNIWMLRSSHFALKSFNISFSVNIGSWLPIIAAVTIFTEWAVLCFRLNFAGISSGISITVLCLSMDFLFKDVFKVWKLAFGFAIFYGDAITSPTPFDVCASAPENFIDFCFFEPPTKADSGLAFIELTTIGAAALAILASMGSSYISFCKSPLRLCYRGSTLVSIIMDPKPMSISGVLTPVFSLRQNSNFPAV